jgi:hypothetical protein
LGKELLSIQFFLHHNGSFQMCGHISRKWARDVNICRGIFDGAEMNKIGSQKLDGMTITLKGRLTN